MARGEFSYRSLNDSRRGRRRLLVVTILVLVVFVGDLLSGGVVRASIRAGAVGLWNVTHGMRDALIGSGYFVRHSTLAKENKLLRQEIASIKDTAAASTLLRQENDLLRAFVRLAQSGPGVTAPVVSSYRASPYGTFAIGVGIDSGIARGDLALTEGGFVVGRVSDVQAKTTLVTSIFSSSATIDIRINGAAASAVGEGGGNARVSIPRGISVDVGDPVVAPTLGGRPVGVVGRVEQISTSAEQKVYISLPINLSLMRFVYILPAHE